MVRGLGGIVIGFILVSLFAVSMISFGVQFASDNNLNQSVLEDYSLDYLNKSLVKDLADTEIEANNTRTEFEKEKTSVATGFFLFGTIINAGKVFTSALSGLYNVLIIGISDHLGIPGVVIGSISAILLIIIVLGGWRIYKAGE